MDFMTAMLGLLTGAIGGYVSTQLKFRSEIKLLEARHSQETEAARSARIDRYQSLLLLAASDFQDRLWHVTQRQAKSRSPVLLKENLDQTAYNSWPMTPRHYLSSSIYLAARYFSTVEMIRHEIRFLTYKQDKQTKKLRKLLTGVERAFAETDLQKETKSKITSDRPLFQMQQVFVGQSVWSDKGNGLAWVPYPDFLRLYWDNLEHTEDFKAVSELLVGAVSHPKGSFHCRRLCIALNALVELIDFLDPPDASGSGIFLERDERQPVKIPNVPSTTRKAAPDS